MCGASSCCKLARGMIIGDSRPSLLAALLSLSASYWTWTSTSSVAQSVERLSDHTAHVAAHAVDQCPLPAPCRAPVCAAVDGASLAPLLRPAGRTSDCYHEFGCGRPADYRQLPRQPAYMAPPDTTCGLGWRKMDLGHTRPISADGRSLNTEVQDCGTQR